MSDFKSEVDKLLKEFEHHLYNAQEGLTRSEAKAQILSLIRSCKPKKKDIEGRLIIDGLHRVYWDGFNSACDLMEKNIDDCMKGMG